MKYLEHIAAIAKTSMSRFYIHNGKSWWTNGHVCVPGDVSGAVELASIGKTLDGIAGREDVPLTVDAFMTSDGGRLYRSMRSSDGKVFNVLEAYWRIVGDLGEPYGRQSHEAIAIRNGREVAALIMGIRGGVGTEKVESATDSEVFEKFASVENDWYLQPAKALLTALAGLEEEIETAEEKVTEYEQNLRGLESRADALRRKIQAARKAEVTA